ncbi:MAG: M15 family metallopeptidase [Myxococcota bacterium]
MSAARHPPPGFVDLRVHLPEARFEIRYHTADNFTGAPLPGYALPGAWLRAPAAAALREVLDGVLDLGLSLHIYDAYRPRRATDAMVSWAAASGNMHLLEMGYIARRSYHNRGIAVDLTLFDRETGRLVDMGTDWDVFHEGSHVANAVGPAAANRQTLHTVMMAQGWAPFAKEWWHFNYPIEGAEPIDVPYEAVG